LRQEKQQVLSESLLEKVEEPVKFAEFWRSDDIIGEVFGMGEPFVDVPFDGSEGTAWRSKISFAVSCNSDE